MEGENAEFRLAILGRNVHTVPSALFILGLRVSASVFRSGASPQCKSSLARMLRVAGCEERPDVGRHG